MQTRRRGRVGWFTWEVGGGHICWHNLHGCRLPRRKLLTRIVDGILRTRLRYVVHHGSVVGAEILGCLPRILSIFGLVWHCVLWHGSRESRGWFLIVAAVGTRSSHASSRRRGRVERRGAVPVRRACARAVRSPLRIWVVNRVSRVRSRVQGRFVLPPPTRVFIHATVVRVARCLERRSKPMMSLRQRSRRRVD